MDFNLKLKIIIFVIFFLVLCRGFRPWSIRIRGGHFSPSDFRALATFRIVRWVERYCDLLIFLCANINSGGELQNKIVIAITGNVWQILYQSLLKLFNFRCIKESSHLNNPKTYSLPNRFFASSRSHSIGNYSSPSDVRRPPAKRTLSFGIVSIIKRNSQCFPIRLTCNAP